MTSLKSQTTGNTVFCRVILALAVLTGLVSLTPQQADAQARIVQLPVVRQFVYRGAVKVPDGGSTLLGGVKRSASGSNSSGAPILGGIPGVGRGFRNRGIGSENNSAQSSVNVKILVMEELEAEMLAEARAKGLIRPADAANEAIRQKAAFLTKHVGRRSKHTQQDSFNNRR